MLVVLQAVKIYISLSSADAIVFQYKIYRKYLISEKKSYLFSHHFRELANIVTLISLYDLYHTE